uniref:Uncharacterized protein n=1 Tax=Syphacia muris TaxID=451379 RepID=A0A0N5B0X6_9BILA
MNFSVSSAIRVHKTSYLSSLSPPARCYAENVERQCQNPLGGLDVQASQLRPAMAVPMEGPNNKLESLLQFQQRQQTLQDLSQDWMLPPSSSHLDQFNSPQYPRVTQQANSNTERVSPLKRKSRSNHVSGPEPPTKYGYLSTAYPVDANQWSKTTTSTSERVKMGLRRSVKARQASSPKVSQQPMFNNGFGTPHMEPRTNQQFSSEAKPVDGRIFQSCIYSEPKFLESAVQNQQNTFCDITESILNSGEAINSQYLMPIELYDFNLGNGPPDKQECNFSSIWIVTQLEASYKNCLVK